MNVYEPSDEYLIACIKGGEIEKASILFDRHSKNIYSYFYRLTRNRVESEDLTQNVFVKLIRFRSSYKPDHQFLPWVFRIAHHAYIDHCKCKSKERHQLIIYNRVASAESENENVEDTLDVFHKAFEKLSPEYRELLILNRYHGLTYKQIGKSLKLNEKAVKQKAFRALEKLRAECKKLESHNR
jgi:RNA polymerase sigma-70 factor (ECF subfamily)